MHISTMAIILSLLPDPAPIKHQPPKPTVYSALAPHPFAPPIGEPMKVKLKDFTYEWNGEKISLRKNSGKAWFPVILLLSLGFWIGVITYCITVGSWNLLIDIFIVLLVCIGIIYTMAHWRGRK